MEGRELLQLPAHQDLISVSSCSLTVTDSRHSILRHAHLYSMLSLNQSLSRRKLFLLRLHQKMRPKMIPERTQLHHADPDAASIRRRLSKKHPHHQMKKEAISKNCRYSSISGGRLVVMSTCGTGSKASGMQLLAKKATRQRRRTTKMARTGTRLTRSSGGRVSGGKPSRRRAGTKEKMKVVMREKRRTSWILKPRIDCMLPSFVSARKLGCWVSFVRVRDGQEEQMRSLKALVWCSVSFMHGTCHRIYLHRQHEHIVAFTFM